MLRFLISLCLILFVVTVTAQDAAPPRKITASAFPEATISVTVRTLSENWTVKDVCDKATKSAETTGLTTGRLLSVVDEMGWTTDKIMGRIPERVITVKMALQEK